MAMEKVDTTFPLTGWKIALAPEHAALVIALNYLSSATQKQDTAHQSRFYILSKKLALQLSGELAKYADDLPDIVSGAPRGASKH